MQVNQIDDVGIRALGIPGFGLSIPHLTGLFGPLGPGDVAWWVGHVWFVALAAAIWQGNRFALFRLRERWSWLDRPVQKLVLLLLANVFFTAPVTLAALTLWYSASGVPADPAAMRTVVLANVICVIFVTHAYETVFLIKERESDLVRLERLDRARAEAQLEALRAQVDPHFLFNALNTLSWLVEHDGSRARSFTEDLARVYRYILQHRDHDLVPLADELAFLRRWFALLEIRFGDAVSLEVRGEPDGGQVPPIALQTLVENAVKHNGFSEREPLRIEVELGDDALVVRNRRRPRRSARPSAGLGLRNLDERCRLALGRPLEVRAGDDAFAVELPVLRRSAAA